MPIYNNPTPATQGNEFLKIPPYSSTFKSIYFYNINGIERTDIEPYYNPILYKNIFTFSENSTYGFEFDDNIIGLNSHIFIQVILDSANSLNSVELFFNNINNLPSLPIANSNFIINNNHRIKRLFLKTKNCTGEIIILVTDKFVPSAPIINYDNRP